MRKQKSRSFFFLPESLTQSDLWHSPEQILPPLPRRQDISRAIVTARCGDEEEEEEVVGCYLLPDLEFHTFDKSHRI